MSHFDTEQIVADQGTQLIPHFVCPICLGLPYPSEAVITNACEHVFCQTCLAQWLSVPERDRCPTCNKSPCRYFFIKDRSQLGHRLLSSIRIKCSLEGCAWSGTTGEFDAHVLSSDAHKEQNMDVTVLQLKTLGNEKFKAARYQEAVTLYTKAISMFPDEWVHGRLTFSGGVGEPMLLVSPAPTPLEVTPSHDGWPEATTSVSGDEEPPRASLAAPAAPTTTTATTTTTPPAEGSTEIPPPSLVMADERLQHRKTTLATLLNNRAAAYLHLKQHEAASEDSLRAIRLCPSADVKFYVRFVHASFEAGRFAQAAETLRQAIGVSSLNLTTMLKKCERVSYAYEELNAKLSVPPASQDFAGARILLNEILTVAPETKDSIPIVARIALMEALFGSAELANRLSLEAIRNAPNDTISWIARAVSLLNSSSSGGGGTVEDARTAAKRAVSLNPDDEFAKSTFKACKLIEARFVREAREAVEAHDYERAKGVYGDLLANHSLGLLSKSSPLMIEFLCQKADVEFKLGEYETALRDATAAIEQRDDSVRAWLVRFYCLRHLSRFKEAVELGRGLLERWGANDHVIKSTVERAEFDLRRANRPDLYGALQVSSLASEMEIKQAYKLRALQCHPDKVKEESERPEAERKFKVLGLALEILGNPEKRKLWDEGYDVEGINAELQRREASAGRHRHP